MINYLKVKNIHLAITGIALYPLLYPLMKIGKSRGGRWGFQTFYVGKDEYFLKQ